MLTVTRASTRIAALGLTAAIALPGALLPRPAQAGDWARSFEGPQVAAHVDAAGQDILVLAAGPKQRRSVEAAADLRAGLGPEAKRVGNGKTLGALGQLDDDEILAKAKALHPDRIAIVRVFDDTDDAEAVVTIYDGEGRTIGGFAAHPGDTVEAPTDLTVGHDQQLADAIAGLETDNDEAEAAFERKRVVFDESVFVSASNGVATVSRRFHPMTGDGHQLKGGEFYRYVGRDDLASKYRTRKTTRVVLGASAIATSVTGLGLMLGYGVGKAVSVSSRTCDGDIGSPTYDMCESDKSADRKQALKVGLGAGSGLLIGGIVLAIVTARIDPNPIAGTEALGLARDFNDNLRAELGLPKRRRDVSKVSASPSAGRDGLGLQIAGRF